VSLYLHQFVLSQQVLAKLWEMVECKEHLLCTCIGRSRFVFVQGNEGAIRLGGPNKLICVENFEVRGPDLQCENVRPSGLMEQHVVRIYCHSQTV
jgi:hypothetical protein